MRPLRAAQPSVTCTLYASGDPPHRYYWKLSSFVKM